jgi:hypothetical protein
MNESFLVPRTQRSTYDALLSRGPSPCSVPMWVPALRRTAPDDVEPVIGRALRGPVGIAGEALRRVRDNKR